VSIFKKPKHIFYYNGEIHLNGSFAVKSDWPHQREKEKTGAICRLQCKLYHYKIKISFTSIISTTVIPKQLDSRRGDGIDERYHQIKWMCVYDLMIVVSGKKHDVTGRNVQIFGALNLVGWWWYTEKVKERRKIYSPYKSRHTHIYTHKQSHRDRPVALCRDVVGTHQSWRRPTLVTRHFPSH
jgi:hypothetical protein